VKFDNLRLAFEVVQVPQEMVEGIFSVLSSVLWLGNMTFKVNLFFLMEKY
jgi:myosin heavy subunit